LIPASYLFKNTYYQHWEEPDLPQLKTQQKPRFFDGLVAPLLAAMPALFVHGPRAGEHSYDGSRLRTTQR